MEPGARSLALPSTFIRFFVQSFTAGACRLARAVDPSPEKSCAVMKLIRLWPLERHAWTKLGWIQD